MVVRDGIVETRQYWDAEYPDKVGSLSLQES